MFIIRNRNAFFAITGIALLAALGSIFAFGLHLGPDFTGGTLVEIRYDGGYTMETFRGDDPVETAKRHRQFVEGFLR